MELHDALRATAAVREFADRPVPRDVLIDILDDARFAPSGGNRQPWHVTVVEDPAIRRGLRDLYVDAWRDYVAASLAGLVPFSPLATADDHLAAAAQRPAAEALADPASFPERLHEVPALLVVTADLSVLAALDRDQGRYTLVGGASVYPFVWSLLLAARDRGLGGVITTMVAAREGAARELLALPGSVAIVAVVALGYPSGDAPTRLRRRPVERFATVDRFDGPPLTR